MNLRQLSYFMKIAECGSQTAASRQLNVSQPALGFQIRELENELAVELFRRRSRGMELTEAGKELVRHAEGIFQRMDAARDAMRSYSAADKKTLSLGAPPTPGKLLIPGLMRTVASSGRVSIRVREGLSSDLAEQVRQGELDLALCYDPIANKDLHIRPLLHDDLVLISPPGQIGPAPTPIDFHALGRYPLILDSPDQITRKLIDRQAIREKVTLNIVIEVESVNLKRELLLSQGCCSIVPLGLFNDAIDRGQFEWAPIVSPSITRTLCLVSRRILPKSDFDYIHTRIEPIIADHIHEGKVNWQALA
ncbi:LysR family transcriptional regulator [Alkalilacustris brevis]|uniref:LysR family transcriptional regulator n=1 Tax=Alkalilacustris brevis TaxID=2026338 RepID=UPI000E0D9A59|nr:LysR family transcriptional regulator [Alkalilacustris brevis]